MCSPSTYSVNFVIRLVSESSSTPIPTRDIHNRVVEALVTDSILTSSTKNCLSLEEYLLVRSSEVTSVMVTSLKQHSHVNVSRQHSITHIHFLSGWLPFQRPPLHNWAIRGKVHTNKSNFIIESVAFHSDEREVKHTQRYKAKIREEVSITRRG